MKKLLLLLAVAVVLLASCAKDSTVPNDSEGKPPVLSAEEIIGAWKFEAPANDQIIVKATNEIIAKSISEEIGAGTEYSVLNGITITFNKNFTCTGIDDSDESDIISYSGVYMLFENRIRIVLSDGEQTFNLNMEIQLKDEAYLCVADKDTYIEALSVDLNDITLTKEQKQALESALSSLRKDIEEISYPYKMTKIQPTK